VPLGALSLPTLKFDVKRLARYDDPREMPAYTVAEAAHYLSIPKATVSSWVRGRTYPVADGSRKRFHSVIDLPDRKLGLLSFYNLAEAHILRALRTSYKIRLPHIRKALSYVRKECGWDRPLIQAQFKTDGVSLFVNQLGKLVDAAAQGQLVMAEILTHLDRIDWENHLAVRIYPFTRVASEELSPRSVVIDPLRAFGRPLLDKLGVTTSVIAERYKAGDSIELLMRDYGGSQVDIQEAIRCELQIATAA
jgi:uncharacterized protein (DUF433 family)